MGVSSWGRFPRVQQRSRYFEWISDSFPMISGHESILPFGQGRSYGDSCLNDQNWILKTERLNHWIAFDPSTGLLRCEAGVTLENILEVCVPQGWFLPVTPGTQFVSLGGAIANDVHGKNHHYAGTFGCHVKAFEILRSDQQRLYCSMLENKELFCATIGGLGLTGLILWAEIQMKSIKGPWIDQEVIPFKNLDAFFQLAEESELHFEHTVAWLDCLASGNNLGRGLFIRGNHSQFFTSQSFVRKKKSIPCDFPDFVLNGCTIKIFNELYYRKTFLSKQQTLTHYDSFFYPLDSILHWNRLYGQRGFLQYQCVVPFAVARDLLVQISNARKGSFLAVMKTFGALESPGWLSFPRPGVTIALDFVNEGEELFVFLNSLDEKVLTAGGAVYPAKDARMSREAFESFFPKAKKFSHWIDPKFSSSFWRRVS